MDTIVEPIELKTFVNRDGVRMSMGLGELIHFSMVRFWLESLFYC